MKGEITFSNYRSEGKHCAICMECVVNKMNKSDRRFGILGEFCSQYPNNILALLTIS